MTLLIYIVGCVAIFLPTAFAGGVYCGTCPSDPLQSPSQCNMSTTSTRCSDDSSGTCFAATAELINGTFISLKGCFIKKDAREVCNNDTACARFENTTGLASRFKRCVADCCVSYPHNCNKYRVPSPWKVEPSSSTPATSSVSPTDTQAPTTTTTGPISVGTKIKAFSVLPIFLLFVTQIAN